METLRKVTLITATIGGAGAVCLMLMSGLHPPVLLVVLFIGWVLAPFAALVFANLVSRRWSIVTRYTLYSATLVIAVCSLAIYGYVLFRPPVSQPAFPYVAVPVGSWLFIAIALPVAALISRGRTRRGDQ